MEKLMEKIMEVIVVDDGNGNRVGYTVCGGISHLNSAAVDCFIDVIVTSTTHNLIRRIGIILLYD